MAGPALTPVVVGLRTGLHVLFASLVVLVVARAVLAPTAASGAVIALSAILLATYGLGVLLERSPSATRGPSGPAWLAVLALEWIALLWLSPEAAYLVFPLFFLFLHVLGPWWGTAAIVASTVVAIVSLGVHGGWSVGGVVGPLVGAGVALLIGHGAEALARESRRREALLRELIDTRDQLAASEHEAGVLAERSRLAREIHDTVAQGLSSIQLLLHAAERADPERPGVEHVRLARETAAASLADARRFIRELAPPDLAEAGLGGALRRLAATQWAAQGLDVLVRVADAVELPMPLQSALLRICQGAIANVVQHAGATTATIELQVDGDRLRLAISDDGRGFDPDAARDERPGRSDSFGLRATSERVEQLGGVLVVDSAPGRGTTVAVEIAPWRPS